MRVAGSGGTFVVVRGELPGSAASTEPAEPGTRAGRGPPGVGGPRPGSRQARPRRTAAASASTGMVTGCGAPATAQSGSFRPLPVTVQTIF